MINQIAIIPSVLALEENLVHFEALERDRFGLDAGELGGRALGPEVGVLVAEVAEHFLLGGVHAELVVAEDDVVRVVARGAAPLQRRLQVHGEAPRERGDEAGTVVGHVLVELVLRVGRDEVVVFQLGQHDVVIDAVHVLVEVEQVPVVVLEQQLGPHDRFLAVLFEHLHQMVPLAEVISGGLASELIS